MLLLLDIYPTICFLFFSFILNVTSFLFRYKCVRSSSDIVYYLERFPIKSQKQPYTITRAKQKKHSKHLHVLGEKAHGRQRSPIGTKQVGHHSQKILFALEPIAGQDKRRYLFQRKIVRRRVVPEIARVLGDLGHGQLEKERHLVGLETAATQRFVDGDGRDDVALDFLGK